MLAAESRRARASIAQHGCALGERVPEFALASGVGDAPAALLTSLNETATLVDVRTGGARGAIDGHAGGASTVKCWLAQIRADAERHRRGARAHLGAQPCLNLAV